MVSQSQQSTPENKAGSPAAGEETAAGEVVDEQGVRQPDPAQPGEQQGAEAADTAADSDDPAELQAALDDARQQARENWEKLVRLQAEMDNLRKRTSRDVEHAHKYALDKFVAELLPVVDSLELGISAAGESGQAGSEADSLREGMELTLKKFLDALDKFGVEPVDPQGEKFNPELHEAVSMQESSEAGSNTVITVVQKGYTLNGRLVRPAMVVVAK